MHNLHINMVERFQYNQATSHKAAKIAFLPAEELVNQARPLSLLKDLLEELTGDFKTFILERPACEAVYYLLMLSRERLPQFFPVHDLCLLAANLLRPSLKSCPNLVLLDWEMLPSAVLAAGCGASITLPPYPAEEKDAALKLATILRHYLPEAQWQLCDNQPLCDCLVLGQHPLAHGERNSRFLESLKDISGGLLYTAWDFLGVKLHAHTRSLWIKSGLIRGVLQLPRPRRQRAALYPALIELAKADTCRKIRLARIPDWGIGPGSLDQVQASSLLAEHAPAAGDFLDISPEELAKDGLFNLSPNAHLTRQAGQQIRGGLTLRQCVQVLRCQVPRKRLEDLELEALQSQDQDWLGEYPDGTFLCREVSLGELDPLTGFLEEQSGNVVRLPLTLLGKQGKYVLQSGDILFAFRGTSSSVGQVGFVEDEGAPGITGQTLCILRCLPETDPVWLYHYLQRPKVREQIRSKASGRNLLTINLESIRELPISLPSQAEIDEINAEHRIIAERMSAMAGLRRDIRASLWRIRHCELEYKT